MIYEIINPSDPYTFEAPDLEIATAVVLILGNGWYGAKDSDDKDVIPILAFTKDDTWFKENLGKTIDEFFTNVKIRTPEFRTSLESVLIGNRNDRATFNELITHVKQEEIQSFREKWHDGKRSSLNDIGTRAHDIAKTLCEVVS